MTPATEEWTTAATEDLDRLNQRYVEVRHPGEWGLRPAGKPAEEDARQIFLRSRKPSSESFRRTPRSVEEERGLSETAGCLFGATLSAEQIEIALYGQRDLNELYVSIREEGWPSVSRQLSGPHHEKGRIWPSERFLNVPCVRR